LQAFNEIDIWAFQLREKLSSVNGKALHVLPLTFGAQCIARQAAFSRSAGTSNYNKLIAWDIEIDVF
jgi:hypothetical protein